MTLPTIAITTGEPAGIGPDITLMAAMGDCSASLIAIGDAELLQQRAEALSLPVVIRTIAADHPVLPHQAGILQARHVPVATAVQAGILNSSNASYVLDTLDAAIDGCIEGRYQAMVTAPVQKSVINDAGIGFSGHTEYLAERTGTDRVVMMLASEQLRVALATTHLPLAAVSATITRPSLETTLRILHRDLQQKFGIAEPTIAVLGLNPHAGEGGHLGREEIAVITPALDALRSEGMQLIGPLPADTAFNPQMVESADAFLAMYHDQGLPVLKYASFGQAVNITLGLPIVRTSVDHGTALELAGTGRASAKSLATALNIAIQMSGKPRSQPMSERSA